MSDKKLWFKAKQYGWGWTPVSWEGWLVVIGYITSNLVGLSVLSGGSPSIEQILIPYTIWLGVTTALLLRIGYQRGEKPHWRWGKK
jgi:hypothetical protein